MNNNLIVIASAAPLLNIQRAFPDHRIVDDGQIFQILNGTPFDEKQFGLDTIEQLCDAFVAQSEKEALVIHTFNPVIQNYLMCYLPLEKPEDRLVDDLGATRQRFQLWKPTGNDGLFISALDIANIAKKMDVLCIGDALCDVFLEAEINEFSCDQ